ncbi:hypothetical protein HID58_073920 [Brassica napus]|uniref:Uncharacterized protein n=1 Tax=Brassica napus TaxID=3708 RepID=A0ABQ7YF82_BRANA|nr:hypothetical protein HID58_092777 [Brassica napus]KAH0866898.1 hypothetical protein HID58_073920 [Brassica napus]
MTPEDDTNQVEATPREVELLNRLEALQSQITDLHKVQETMPGGHELLQEVQTLKDQLGEHSKQLQQSAEKLDAMEAENLVLPQENQTLGATGKKWKRFRAKVRPMASLITPRNDGGTSRQPAAAGDGPDSRETARDATRLFRVRSPTSIKFKKPCLEVTLLQEVQTLKDQLGEHSKQLQQSAEKLDAMEAENLVL